MMVVTPSGLNTAKISFPLMLMICILRTPKIVSDALCGNIMVRKV